MLSMSKLPYHFGIKMRAYFSNQQRMMIKENSDASRFVYNKLVELDQKKYQLLRTGHHRDYFKLIHWLMDHKQVSYNFAKFMVDHHYVSDKTIRKVKTKNCYKYVGATIIPWVYDQLCQVEQRQNMRQLANHYLFLNNNDVDSLTLANSKQNYRKAWNQYRKVHNAGTPNYHKKSYVDKYQTSNHYSKNDKMTMYTGVACFVDEKHIKLPKLGVVRISGSNYRKFLNRQDIRIGTVTITKTADDKYYVSMSLASSTPFVNKMIFTNQVVGVDLNLDNFLTTSNGDVVANPRYYRKQLKRLKHAQRKLSRRQRRAKQEHRKLRDSKNYQKQCRLVVKLQQQVMNRRKDFVNKQAIALVNSHDLVVAEDLQSHNMLKNHALAMSISDVGWRMFLDALEKKANMLGKTFIKVNPQNTTQTCSCCGYICGSDDQHGKLTLKDRSWTCPNCQTYHVRDVNAAQNILAKGLAESVNK